jgi:hypothetical protein
MIEESIRGKENKETPKIESKSSRILKMLFLSVVLLVISSFVLMGGFGCGWASGTAEEFFCSKILPIFLVIFLGGYSIGHNIYRLFGNSGDNMLLFLLFQIGYILLVSWFADWIFHKFNKKLNGWWILGFGVGIVVLLFLLDFLIKLIL